MKETFPQFEYTTYAKPLPSLIKVGETSFFEDGVSVGGDFFEIFSYQFLHGDALTALDNPDAVILTETLSKKYFGNYKLDW